jgi:hypothetical protein
VSYSSASSVAALTRNLTGNKQYSTSTCPTINEVNSWLSSGCAVIESKLAVCNYSVPVTAGTVAYDWLGQLNTLYAAAFAEMSRTTATLEPNQRTKGQILLDEFWKQLDMICKGDLVLAGLTRTGRGLVYAGGTKRSEKQVWEGDSGRVGPRFSRNQFSTPGRLDPSGTTAS